MTQPPMGDLALIQGALVKARSYFTARSPATRRIDQALNALDRIARAPGAAETVESMCHWTQGRGNARDESHEEFHYGSPCPYESMAAVLRGEPDPRDAELLLAHPADKTSETDSESADRAAVLERCAALLRKPWVSGSDAEFHLREAGCTVLGELDRVRAEVTRLTAERLEFKRSVTTVVGMGETKRRERGAALAEVARYRATIEQLKDDAQTVVPDQKREWLALWLAQRLTAAFGDGA